MDDRGWRSRRIFTLGALALLYAAQGVPYGFATKYLPFVLRQAHFSRTKIASLGWLQLPWYLKPLWSPVADVPSLRSGWRARVALFSLQCLLAVCVAGFALFDVVRELPAWLALTFLAAATAATQDLFVDAFAVRALGPEDRGAANAAQVAGYKLGALAGGAGMLLLARRAGPGHTALYCAGAIALTAALALLLRRDEGPSGEQGPHRTEGEAPRATSLRAVLALVARALREPSARAVALLALTYKLAPTAAGSLLEPMLADLGWTPARVGFAVVTVGTVASLVGSATGGWIYHALGERRALVLGCVAQSVAIVPLVFLPLTGAPYVLSTVAIALDHLASGVATTALFAALMTATNREAAATHYTVLTSMNVVALATGGMLGGIAADLLAKVLQSERLAESVVFGLSVMGAALPLYFVRGWDQAARASATPR